MKIIRRILLALLLIVALVASYIQFYPAPTYDIAIPEVSISTDSAVIARGEYLIYGPAHCAGCHCSEEDAEAVLSGKIVPLVGGKYFDVPNFGKFNMSNITPDLETGIGNLSNGEIARAMRYGVNHHGLAMIPVMPYTYMSESDISAIISYLRVQEPIHNEVPQSSFVLIGKMIQKFMLRPKKASREIKKQVEVGPTVEYGEYIVRSVANCEGCHTTFDMMTFDYDGVPLSGGMEEIGEKYIFKAPNLTPDPKTGHIYDWSEEQFVTRFKGGMVYEKSPMPWPFFSKMPEVEIIAMYRYLKSIPSCENETGPSVKLLEDLQ